MRKGTNTTRIIRARRDGETPARRPVPAPPGRIVRGAQLEALEEAERIVRDAKGACLCNGELPGAFARVVWAAIRRHCVWSGDLYDFSPATTIAWFDISTRPVTPVTVSCASSFS